MKKIVLLAVLAAVLLLSGCVKDKNEEWNNTSSEADTSAQSQQDTTDTATSEKSSKTETTSEIPNDADDGYTKTY